MVTLWLIGAEKSFNMLTGVTGAIGSISAKLHPKRVPKTALANCPDAVYPGFRSRAFLFGSLLDLLKVMGSR